jgi:Xaa-Pro aminopeptidase
MTEDTTTKPPLTRAATLAKAHAEITANRLDALVAASPGNVYYTSGTYFMTQKNIPERLGLVSITSDDDPAFVYCTIEEGHATQESWLKNLRGYTEFADQPVDVLVDVLKKQGADRGRIGVEKRFFSAIDFERLRNRLPKAEFVDADPIFDRMRAIKTPEEIRILGDAAMATDAAIRVAFTEAAAGMTELAVGEMMVAEAKNRGGEKLLHLVLAAGANGFKIHAEPGTTQLKSGDVLRTDFGMIWSRFYLSDIARTAFVGRLEPWQDETYRKLEHVQQTTIAAMKPGVKASDVYRICADAFARAGVEFKMPHIGHGIGVVIHENPMLHPFDHTILEPGMVFMLEPAIRGRDGFYHTEDMIEITETGQRVLSRSADWATPMVIS